MNNVRLDISLKYGKGRELGKGRSWNWIFEADNNFFPSAYEIVIRK